MEDVMDILKHPVVLMELFTIGVALSVYFAVLFKKRKYGE